MKAPPRRILFVDDDADLLDGLRNALHGDRARWEMRFAEGAAEALVMLQEEAADLVITDMRMPEMDGLALLERVRSRWPFTARVVLSGQAELPAVVRASSVAHRYLLKPCDLATLRAVITRTCLLQDRLEDDGLVRSLGTLGSLPAAPRTYQALNAALERDDAAPATLARLVESDPAITVRLLGFANSAYFGLVRQISSVEEAIIYLGVETLRDLVLTLEVFGAFGPAVSLASQRALLHHALLTARIARRLSAGAPFADAAFAAALLHDAGRLAFMTRLPEPWEAACQRSVASGRALHLVEREILGADHAQVGGYLLGLWGLPAAVVEAVTFHHDPVAGAMEPLDAPAVVTAANLLALRASPPPFGLPEAEDGGALQSLAGNRLAGWLRLADEEARLTKLPD